MFWNKSGYDVFLSYRRDGGADFAQAVWESLKRRGYRPFLDVKDMPAGDFGDSLLRVIDHTPDFVPLITPGSLDFKKKDDWVRTEIVYALSKQRNIVPLRSERVDYQESDELPAEVKELRKRHSIRYTHEQADDSILKLTKLLKSRKRVLFRHYAAWTAILLLLVCLGVGLSRWWSPAAPLSLYWYAFGQRLEGDDWKDFKLTDGMSLSSEDQFRISFVPTADAYIYILNIDASGETTVLFPNQLIDQSGFCEAGTTYEVPDGNKWFELDNKTGEETIYLIASHQPIDDLEGLLRQTRTGEPSRTSLETIFAEAKTPPISPSGDNITDRGIGIRPDARLATATLASGKKVSKPMNYSLGRNRLVTRIQFNHVERLPR